MEYNFNDTELISDNEDTLRVCVPVKSDDLDSLSDDAFEEFKVNLLGYINKRYGSKIPYTYVSDVFIACDSEPSRTHLIITKD